MAFSWKQAKIDAINKKIANAIILSGLNKAEATGNPDYIAKHHYKDVTEIKVKVKAEVIKQQEMAQIRRNKLVGKN